MATYDPFRDFDDIFRALNGSMDSDRLRREQQLRAAQQQSQLRQQEVQQAQDGGLLEQFGINMTELARQGKFDPVIGRDDEIARVIEILNRRTKNNPVLIGEAGVGKTAVVEGLAQAIVNGEVPAKLQNKEVIRLDVVSLVQGTGVRGQFEERMQKLMDEVSKRDDIILFIDEIHEIMGAGTAGEGSMDAGNILKPALARGEFQLVGATTLNEYRQIEKDAAIARRFQTVQVNEPSTDEALQILNGIRSRYEDYHKVKYSDEALEAAVNLSNRYIQERFLPDKAIDLIDEAGSRKNLTIKVDDPAKVQKQIDYAEKEKQAAIDREDFEKAGYWKTQAEQLQRQLEAAKTSQPVVDDAQTVTVKDIQQIVEEKTGIPVGELQESEQTQLNHLAENLAAHVIGQDEATSKIARAIRRNRVGFNKSGRPIGSFLFVGPTGVGKTETAKRLAKELFGTTDSMIRFDMSEYMEKHSVSKLIGAPAGYVGYEEAGQLTEAVRRHPYSLILLDEVEKAHPDVMNMFLQVLDDGRLTDAQGHTVSFKDTVIIMTSNAGTGVKSAKVGFDETTDNDDLMARLAPYFKPEFLNRFDAVIEFNALSKANLLQIVDLMLADMQAVLVENGLSIEISADVKDRLVDLGYDPTMGARPLRRVIQDQLEDQIADFYLDNPDIKQLQAELIDDEIKVAALHVDETVAAS
ncbi:ATP-dependent Clp protease ATP-binding subunit [Weissella soli]|uniref:ATP-dependent Clp protease ATP-binding subunit ClpE n=1 Tax=Weissella soli TaxID=155866 RepID=A0A288QXR7_9LACO|nr:ATP-dependent Clp protease ATP-binding subunit [Weissella soli]AOT56953.1 ATP-dependent Clp protease ATP-binding subunit ClpE [Weissella soli]MCT8395607.1 ATP-dependent Clp protease ATP-binding subunit [Weissella soli]NKY83404.1 ATP-dependent Clp protease ATP-binding subunit [Weissella soli]RDL05304.1 ATP-dependent Clp protease ATP-binding subunit ClpE [Weissella soli]GEN93655.1 ATP-dependent Clp protease ATP-binding subunit ClpE [Weissella soli]